ncbi:TPA: beta-propeller fold lactonase family protein [Enterobacter hormaechei subsp. steigerwaltii]|nr:beta-propeller fold lactonase family protein [Enterobacter hormaechei subsp. steigerwaltii]
MNTNESVNHVIHYAQKNDGTLAEISRMPTAGQGTGGYKKLTGQASAPDDIISSGAIAVSRDHQLLFVVNTGDNSVSGFKIGSDGELHLMNKVSTETDGDANTLTYNDKDQLLYVGNAFGPAHIKTFRVDHGHLSLLPGSQSVNTPEATDRILTQVQISPDNRYLLANVLYDRRPEKVNGKFQLSPANKTVKNGLAVFPILPSGEPGTPRFFDAGGEAPFGLRFIGDSRMFVNTLDSDPGYTVLSRLNDDGTINVLSKAAAKVSTPGKEGIGTCWVSFSPDGQVAFVTGYDTGEIASFRIADNQISFAEGRLGMLKKTDLSSDPAAVGTGSPIGSWSSSNGYLYQLYPSAAKLVGYRISGESLERVGSNSIPLNSTQGITGF